MADSNETMDEPSFTILDADGSPTPMRRVKSAVLTSKKSKESPLRAGTTISPLKLALHQKQLGQTQKPTHGSGQTPKQNHGSMGKKPRPVSSPAASPPRMSLVKKGMRNIFAPPSPPPLPVTTAAVTTQVRADPARVIASIPGVSFLQNQSQPSEQSRTASKVSSDKRFSGVNHLGLPLPPPEDRISPRRQAVSANVPPKVSLPPVPDVPSATNRGKMSAAPMDLHLYLPRHVGADYDPGQAFLSPTLTADCRNSFDFTGEYAKLDSGDQRHSFVQALAKVQGMSSSQAAMPPTPIVRAVPARPLDPLLEDQSYRVHADSLSSGPPAENSDTEDSDTEDENVARVLPPSPYSARASLPSHSPRSSRDSISSKSSTATQRRSPRPPPFQGNPAFQMRVSQQKESITPGEANLSHALAKRPSLDNLLAEVDAAAAAAEAAAVPPPSNHIRLDSLEPPRSALISEHGRNDSLEPPRPAYMDHSHGRAESGLSIATMSSLGAVIETGIAGEYTNYFEVNFTKHLEAQSGSSAAMPPLSTVTHSRPSLANSTTVPPLQESSNVLDRPRPKKRHHRRNSSIASIDSLPGLELLEAAPNGPPVSMYNPRRASHITYVSRHRRGTSSDGSFGRPDWAAHRRGTSRDSTGSFGSTTSIGQLGRPGLGEKMFELDGGMQLTAITASPPEDRGAEDEYRVVRNDTSAHARNDSLDSILDMSFRELQPGAQCPDFGQLNTRDDDSIFGDTLHNAARDCATHSREGYESKASWDSILDASFRQVRPGAHYPDMGRLIDDGDSIFGDTSHLSALSFNRSHRRAQASAEREKEQKEQRQGFFLEPLRPISMINSTHSAGEEEGGDDTSINVAKYAKHIAASAPAPVGEQCFEGEGEDDTISQLYSQNLPSRQS